ncbi:MAG: DpnD/PcfM family protein [Clostridiales bacterium]|nr:DpnD protein [Clostridiales bacterium]MDU3241919.1 DpnD/PcfM family protein [Clostridiales bacterium]
MEEREYEITIREVLERTVVKKDISEKAALEKVKADYNSEKIILDADDFAYNEFTSRVLSPVKNRGR